MTTAIRKYTTKCCKKYNNMIMVNNRYKMANVVKNTTDFGEKVLKY